MNTTTGIVLSSSSFNLLKHPRPSVPGKLRSSKIIAGRGASAESVHQYDRESLKHHPISTTINWLPTNDLRIIRPKLQNLHHCLQSPVMVELITYHLLTSTVQREIESYPPIGRFNPDSATMTLHNFFAMVNPAPVPPPYLKHADA